MESKCFAAILRRWTDPVIFIVPRTQTCRVRDRLRWTEQVLRWIRSSLADADDEEPIGSLIWLARSAIAFC